MHNWNFTPSHSITLTLAADARLCQTEYTNDHIWVLNIGKSEPPSISLETTFGLRARLCRIFPRFFFNGQVIIDPAHFSHPITIHQYYPNYIALSFKPFSSINVKLEYWVPSSQVIACWIKITNTSHEECPVQIEWDELLLPSAEGIRMAATEIGMTTILAGKTADISPVLFLTGGAQPGKSPYPSLNLSYSIPPRSTQESHWVHATLPDMTASFALAKDVINMNWNAEFSHISRVNSRMLEIFTGDKEWDSAFLLSQNIAYQLFLQPTRYCKSSSYVYTRKPDHGYTLIQDGSDYNHLWNGQTAIDTRYLMNFLLPAAPELVQGLLDNFLDAQYQNGEIDMKPGLGGQRTHLLATPLLAFITLQLFEYTGDIDYLKAVFPRLYTFFLSWFSSVHDRDGDQIPEWDQTVQTGYEDLPLFSYHHPWSLGVDISSVESPDLISYLYRECKSLITIANHIKKGDVLEQLEIIASRLKSMVESTWSDQNACYHYRDRDSHYSISAEIIGSVKGQGIIDIRREFIPPIRPIVHISTSINSTRPTQIFIHGNGIAGSHRVEYIPSNRIHWQPSSGYVTSEYTYSSIEQIEITGIQPDDSVDIQSVNLTSMDQSLLLPVWAGIPSTERAKVLINLTIMNKKKFLSPYGLRSCIDFPEKNSYPEEFFSIHLPWTEMIVDGLIQYGERKKAAEVFMRLMKPVAHILQHDMTLYQSFHSETGKPLGAENTLTGLIPIGLFLRILGVRIINPTKVELSGHNPFPWPVTLKFQGLTIVKQEHKTFVIFPDGQNITIDNDQSQMVICEKSVDSGTNLL